ncbi:WD40 repeat-like protein [Nadsonia fulvescens var. elongata DSM 6958]|uniref:WD40 repeat-like protein n=1 Tax=Nadsonia fulvescens var. elongata DSM 6958 TaxID=857566 RepID=A0A1E3PQ27_9ASCO|nr:WD40 repeat-like protein [Nadsonia fulvescens var. elongata DSM 6958]
MTVASKSSSPSVARDTSPSTKSLRSDIEVEQKIINEEYKIWKKHCPLIYDIVLSTALLWPTLTVEWLPDTLPQGNGFSTSSLLLGTHTSKNASDYVQVMDVNLPSALDGKSSINLQKPDENFNQTSIKQKFQHKNEVNKARYNPFDPNFIATMAITGDALIFDRSAITNDSGLTVPKFTLSHHTKEGWGLAWSPHVNGQLLTGSEDSTVALWDIQSVTESVVKPKTVIDSHTAIVNDVQWSKKNTNIFGSVSDDLSLHLHDMRSLRRPVHKCVEHTMAVNSLHFNYHSEYALATGSADDTVKIWDLRNLRTSWQTLVGHGADVTSVKWSPHEGSVLASAGHDRRVLIWDLSKIEDEGSEDSGDYSSELLFMHGGHTNNISDFDWNPNLPWVIASASEDNIIQVWRPTDAIINSCPVPKSSEGSDNE